MPAVKLNSDEEDRWKRSSGSIVLTLERLESAPSNTAWCAVVLALEMLESPPSDKARCSAVPGNSIVLGLESLKSAPANKVYRAELACRL